jgi:hypothetical protein
MYSECVFVALVIQHAKRMRRVIQSSVGCPRLRSFFYIFHKRYDFQGRGVIDLKCYDSLYDFCLKYFSF